MLSDAVQRFLDHAASSGLLATDDARAALAPLELDATATLDHGAAHLVEQNLLTPYQAEQLRAGRGEECVVAGRYRILRKIGEGGMGAVYEARDGELDRVVAVEILPAHRLKDPDAVERFRRETRALAHLSHPHIIQAYDSGADRGRQFLVMEFVNGVALDRVLRQHGPLAPALVADLLRQAALGLAHAHERGLIHRDIKPANLLVEGLTRPSADSRTAEYPGPAAPSRVRPGSARVRILDLGLARFLQDQLGDARLTHEGMGMGTPDYMAPEQFRDAMRADARTDIYGLGCTAYHLLTRRVPFPGSSFSEKAAAHAKKVPVALEERCPDIPAGLAEVVRRMMAKRPAERFASAAEVAGALEPFADGASQPALALRQTRVMPPSQATMRMPARSLRPLALALLGAAVVGTAAVAAAVALLVFAWPSIFPPDDPAPPNGNPAAQGAPPPPKLPAGVLTVASNGTGQFATIAAALDAVQPGQTIRVLDDGVYPENLLIGPDERHHGITLEGPNRPTVAINFKGGEGLRVSKAPNVTVRDLRFVANAAQVQAVRVRGKCPGLRLENLEMKPDAQSRFAGQFRGIMVHGHGDEAAAGPPVVIRKCVIFRPENGIEFQGVSADNETPILCSRAIACDNLVVSPARGYGILVRGWLRQILVAGNRVRGPTTMSAMQLDKVADDSDRVVFANNTVHGCEPALRFWDSAPRGTNVQFSSNLFLGSPKYDMVFLDRRPRDWGHAPPSATASVQALATWKFSHNWRELNSPDIKTKGMIPRAETDVIRAAIDVISVDPGNADFLRPRDAELAQAGAGGDLPPYIGALPPAGTPLWDWQKTWDARMRDAAP